MFYVYLYLALVAGAFCTLIANTAMRHDDRHSVGKFGWMILILLTPPLGLVLFVMLSGRKLAAEKCERDTTQLPEPPENLDRTKSPLERIAISRGLTAASERNSVRLVKFPEAQYQQLLELVDSATDRLFVYSFVMDDDPLGKELVDRLCNKASQGVQIRLMIDGFGSFLFPESLLQRVRDAGGRACRFKPISQISRFAHLNFRNHRKMVIADGQRVLLGGANLVSYEITEHPDEDTWVDLSLRIDGFAAFQIEKVFAEDWKFATDNSLNTNEVPEADLQPWPKDLGSGSSDVQVIPIGPDGPHGIVDDLWLSAINRANQRIWIVTPYFVPPKIAMQSLVMAVRRGVDVQILMPDSSDMLPADWVRLDYCRELGKLGATILRYADRMVHAKVLLVDQAAYVGSANFDERSFYLNYELIVGLFSENAVGELSTWFESLANSCRQDPEVDSRWHRFVGTAARLFSEQF